MISTPGDLATILTDLVHAIRGGRGAVLMNLDGVLIEQAGHGGTVTLGAMASEYAGPLRQIQAMAAELSLGAPQRYSVRGQRSQQVFGFASGGLLLAVQASPGALGGQMRGQVARAVTRVGCH
jgi:predicted regulator of Ras-like GTPase activity (Roadblock/LC7/MglB family)